ncbi:hypothetical protein L7F22_003850 [Adiantum nelumboides]|nr:hypothetical protein [Adiantum nelumboides]
MAVSTDQFKNWFLCAGQESLRRENEALKIENERLVAEMEEMKNNRKEIEDSLSKLKAELSSGLLKPDRNLAAKAKSDVEKQADPDFVADKAVETNAEASIARRPPLSCPRQLASYKELPRTLALCPHSHFKVRTNLGLLRTQHFGVVSNKKECHLQRVS